MSSQVATRPAPQKPRRGDGIGARLVRGLGWLLIAAGTLVLLFLVADTRKLVGPSELYLVDFCFALLDIWAELFHLLVHLLLRIVKVESERIALVARRPFDAQDVLDAADHAKSGSLQFGI